MARKFTVLECLVFVAILYTATLTLILLVYDPAERSCTDNNVKPVRRLEAVDQPHINTIDDCIKAEGHISEETEHKLAVIVPYRDRLEELLEFAPHIHDYLTKKKVRHKIVVVNQVDNLRFNRGSLINIGVLESGEDCDYIAMHDVDLLPLNDQLDYTYPDQGPFHIAAPDLHPLYHYPTFIGGILLITKQHFAQVNGLSNRYYGWGREDDEFYVRLKQAGLLKSFLVDVDGSTQQKFEIRRPKNISTGVDTFKHIHEKQKRVRDNARYFGQKEKTNKMDRETGLMSVMYDLVKTHHLVLNGAPVTMVEVKLKCDYAKTPWCLKKEEHYLLNDLAVPPLPDMRNP